MDVAQAIRHRWACRAFLDSAVPDETIKHILELASWAPSGVNTQPWQVAVVRGDTKQAITETLINARAQTKPNPDYAYYPDNWVEPYKGRRITCGKELYGALDISREDKDAQKTAWENNYRFFGAPVALFIFIDKAMNKGSWMDLGMFIQNILLAACGCGLASCPQASVADYPDQIREVLGIEATLALACGISLGYPDTNHPVNNYRLPREMVESFSHWYD